MIQSRKRALQKLKISLKMQMKISMGLGKFEIALSESKMLSKKCPSDT